MPVRLSVTIANANAADIFWTLSQGSGDLSNPTVSGNISTVTFTPLATDNEINHTSYVIASVGTLTSTISVTTNFLGTSKFSSPAAVAIDADGNLYIADTGNNAVRKITPAGVVSTLAGGTAGSADGTGASARFNRPVAITIDSSGNLYVADENNNAIRKITPAGLVSTFAGGSRGSADGTGSAASFGVPQGITIDNNGTLYVADTYNNAIRKITSAGVVSTIAGGSSGSADGIGTAASFKYPEAITIDSSGNLYVADANNNAIRKITPAGVVNTVAGGSYGSADGTGKAASFKYPGGITIDSSGNLYVADTYNNAIRKITPAGVVSTFAGGSGGSANGTGTAASFNFPTNITIDSSGNLYVADTSNNSIREILSNGYVTTIAGTTAGYIDGTAATRN